MPRRRVDEERADAAGTDDDHVVAADGRPRRIACTAIDIGWAIAATSPLSAAALDVDARAGRDGRLLRQRAIAVESDREVARTQVGPPVAAVGAHAARHAGARGDEVALGEPADVATGGDDGSGELVARCHRAAMSGHGVGGARSGTSSGRERTRRRRYRRSRRQRRRATARRRPVPAWARPRCGCRAGRDTAPPSFDAPLIDKCNRL